MATFTKISSTSIITNKEKTIKVTVFKFQKEGTKRVFFAPEIEGKRINSTMFARLYSAESLAREYIKFKTK